jgi:hypothetical protein
MLEWHVKLLYVRQRGQSYASSCQYYSLHCFNLDGYFVRKFQGLRKKNSNPYLSIFELIIIVGCTVQHYLDYNILSVSFDCFRWGHISPS